jgi:hypothetical protein
MYGDVCVVVNPNDKRYKDMIGKKVFNPVNGELIPIIADDYVEIELELVQWNVRQLMTLTIMKLDCVTTSNQSFVWMKMEL